MLIIDEPETVREFTQEQIDAVLRYQTTYVKDE